MTVLIILNGDPYDGTDVTWNALRLARTLRDNDECVRLLLLNDSVDLARESTRPPGDYFDLVEMTKELLSSGVAVRACGTCMERRSRAKGEPAYDGIEVCTMDDVAAWALESDRVLTF